MIDAINTKQAAIAYLIDDIELRFGEYLESKSFPDDDIEILVNNMTKQIFEKLGYEHIACGRLPNAAFIKLSGIYAPKKTQ